MKRGRGRPPLSSDELHERRTKAIDLWYEVREEASQLKAKRIPQSHQDIRGDAMAIVATRHGFDGRDPIKALDKFFQRYGLALRINKRTGEIVLGKNATSITRKLRAHMRSLDVK